MATLLVFETLRTKRKSLTNAEDFVQCVLVFSTPCSTLLTINVSIQVEPCFVLEKQIAQHINPITHETNGSAEFLRLCNGLEAETPIGIETVVTLAA
jgi:hypothetical protein